ncbi:dTMP kinase [Brevundimonas aveniformis]|uniref:dTMP kinase n=1 Tax=Brevundimonas aveniformis TaxID=370977 RepID=UPI000490C6D4|nr:dTMP kinase [Brevundimonas aveniformis]
MTRGRFITFEGGEGAGKSTQARLLVERLQALGISVVLTREPGGSEGAEALRSLLVIGDADRWTPTAETLLMYAGRSDHLTRLIRPALEAGTWIVCDRFSDSTRAYQGAGGGVSPAFIEAIEDEVVGSDKPDLTLVFDMPVEIGLERAFGRDMFEARFESKGLAFHQRLRDAFLAIARDEPGRCALIDASGTLDEVAAQVWSTVAERLDLEP